MEDFKTPALDRLKSVSPDTRTIFHYTTQEGLLGIVKDKALWLSSMRHLSDAAEFGYAVELARDQLNQRLLAERGPRNSYYGSILSRLDATQDAILFVGSFSEHADLLSQWRAYAPVVGGLSVGFEYEHLKTMAAKQGLSIVKCVYDQDEHAAIIREIIDLGGTLVEDGEHEKAVAAFFVGLLEYAPALKHPSFFEERNRRVVSRVLGPKDTKPTFRVGKSMLIPYQEFKLANPGLPIPIARVIVGPTPHMNLSISSLTHLLLSSENVDRHTWTIAPSRTPYRTW